VEALDADGPAFAFAAGLRAAAEDVAVFFDFIADAAGFFEPALRDAAVDFGCGRDFGRARRMVFAVLIAQRLPSARRIGEMQRYKIRVCPISARSFLDLDFTGR
jgi:hypothetical protein